MVARIHAAGQGASLAACAVPAADADPGRQFHVLCDKAYRRDVLERAWELVRRNRGAPGIDRLTIQQVERYGVDRLLDQARRSAEGWRLSAAAGGDLGAAAWRLG